MEPYDPMDPYDPEPRDASQMEKWEYTSLLFPDPITSNRDWWQIVARLNRWGEKGWQLVQFINRSQEFAPASYMAIFKRRKLDGNTMPPTSQPD